MTEYIQNLVVRLLRWSERYTKTDMTYLARGGSWSLLGQGMNVFASLALAVAVSHFVSKESYGIYKYALSLVTILSLFSLNNIGGAVFQSAAQGYDGALLRAFWDNIRWSVLIFIGTFVLGGYYFFVGNTTLAIGILVGGSLSPFLASVSLFSSFLGGKKDFYRQTMYGIFDSVIPIAIFISVILLTQNPLALIITYFITNTLAGWYFYRRTIRVYHASMHLHDEDMLRYSKHLSVMGIIGGISDNLDQILLFHFVGAAQLAIYNFATAIPDQVKGPLKALDLMVQARFATRSSQEIKSRMMHKIVLLSIFYFAFTVLYIAVAPLIYAIFFPNYTDATFYSQIYALSILIFGLGPVSSFLAVKKKIKEQYIVNVASSLFQIIAMAIGVLWWGLMGLIVARVISRFFTTGTSYLLYHMSSE